MKRLFSACAVLAALSFSAPSANAEDRSYARFSVERDTDKGKTLTRAHARTRTRQITVGKMSDGYSAVRRAAVRHGIDPALMLRVAKKESGGNCAARSGSGARGVLQVVGSTARVHGVKNPSALFNCETGADVGVREMKRMLQRSGGNVRLALIGYNCGEGCMKWKKHPRSAQMYAASIVN